MLAPRVPSKVRSLFQSGMLTISDSVCASEHGACALEAAGEGPRLVFTREGAAMSRVVGSPLGPGVADATRPWVLTAGRAWRVDHISTEAHRYTTFAFSREA